MSALATDRPIAGLNPARDKQIIIPPTTRIANTFRGKACTCMHRNHTAPEHKHPTGTARGTMDTQGRQGGIQADRGGPGGHSTLNKVSALQHREFDSAAYRGSAHSFSTSH